MLTSGQIKMARAALGWSIDVLAEKTSIAHVLLNASKPQLVFRMQLPQI